MGRPYVDMTGQRFGKLRVVAPLPQGHSTRSGKFWECVCDCGNTTYALRGNLRHGRHKSCGCETLDKNRRVCYNRASVPIRQGDNTWLS